MKTHLCRYLYWLDRQMLAGLRMGGRARFGNWETG
jgi:hypothetical protein